MPKAAPAPDPATPLAGLVIFAKDIQRVAAFYEGVAGLAVAQSARDHVVLRSATLELVVHGIPARIAREIVIDTPPALREDSAWKPFFPVASLARAREQAQALGGGLQAASREWTARGFRACDGHDPEGNVLQLREPAG
jgi:predicted enzyme related to lactoylglutathione lyase